QFTQPAFPFDRVAANASLQRRGMCSVEQFPHLGIRPSVMPHDPFAQRHPDIINDRSSQSRSLALDQEMLIVFALFASTRPFSEQSQVPDRIHASLPQRSSHKTDKPRNTVSINSGR